MLDANKETWKPISGFPGYEVSDIGNVRSFWKKGKQASAFGNKSPLILQLSIGTWGYLTVGLVRNGKQSRRRVHLLVLEAFHGQRPQNQEARHGPRGRQCNDATNLSWGTHSQNVGEDKVRDGTILRGEKHHANVLTEVQVIGVKIRLRDGESQAAIARSIKVSRCVVFDIAHDKTWAWLKIGEVF